MKIKKIGILNFQFSDHNYGAVLQAAALENKIKNLGYNVEHINYIPYDSNSFKNKLKYGFIGHILKTILKKSKFYDYRRNKSVFENFRINWIKRSSNYCYTVEAFNKFSVIYDAIIVGSDQVWRPKMYPNFNSDIQVYFLNNISSNIRKISYAASFGVDEWELSNNLKLTDTVTKNLKNFYAISVREDSGVNICNNIFNVQSQHVLDPTLLSDKNFFEEIISSEPYQEKSNELIYYKLDIDQNFKNKIKYISQQLNFTHENIYYKESKLWFDSYISVPSWLAKIKNSKLVITDSFHCVCFSIIFNKNFYCIRNKGRGESRLESLLTLLGLEDRLITLDELTAIACNRNIDYSHANEKLNKLKCFSTKYLEDSLK